MSEVDKETIEIFKKYDIDESKFLEIGEIQKLLKDISNEAGIHCPGEKEISTIFNEYDVNKDGLISYSEFIKMYADLKKMAKKS